MRKCLLLLLSSLLLAGCTEPSILRGSGELATPPAGYSKLCVEHPELASCPK